MPFWGSTIQPECHITVNVHDRRTAGGNDSGCTGNGKYSTIRYVFLIGKPAGRGGYSSCPWSPDTAALHAADIRHVDTDFSNDIDRWKAVFDE